MTSLFRPWMKEDTSKEKVEEKLQTLLSSPVINEKNELWLSEVDELKTKPEDKTDRELRYKNVKEHMKKRSEKYLLKKMKLNGGKKVDVSNEQVVPNAWDQGVIPLPPEVPFPASCYPSIDTVINPLEYLTHKPSELCSVTPGFTYSPGSEFLETALTQGFPPNLFEEYARFLTEQQKQAADRSRKQRPKKFRCPHCQVGFSNNGQLKGHIRIHTGERPFKCDAESCGKSFTRNEELTRHRRIHSGLRPFPCSECGKRFGRKDHLKKHVKTHFQQRYQIVPILPSHCPYFYGL